MKQEAIKDLVSVSNKRFNINTGIAILSFHKKKYSSQIEMLILLLEYFQLISLIICLAFESLMKDQNPDENVLSKAISFVSELFNPFHYLDRRNDSSELFVTTIFSIGICFFLIKHLLFAYIVGKILYNIPSFNVFIKIWQYVFKIQGRVLYSFVTSLWVALIKIASRDDINTFWLNKTGIIIISSIMITIEYIESFVLSTKYCYIVPTKNFLSEKNSYTQVITLTQKLLLQIVQICFSSNFKAIKWVLPSLCLITDLIRNHHHFRNLPLYNIKPLFYQGSILMINTSLSLLLFVQVLLTTITDNDYNLFLWVTWIILLVLTVKLSKIYLRRRISDIVTSYKNKSLGILIHKVTLIKQIRRMTKAPYEYNNRYDFSFLLKETSNARIRDVLNLDPGPFGNTSFDINSKESANKAFIVYYESLMNKYPKNNLIKLCLAYLYVKKSRAYMKAIKITKELEKCRGQIISLNTSLLISDIQHIINSRYEDPNSVLDLSTFIKSQSYFAKIKHHICKQTELQIRIYQELMVESPRMTQINKWSQQIHLYRDEIEHKAKQMFTIIPDYFIEPLAFLAHYYFFVNHSINDALEYRQTFFRKYEKYKKAFNSDKLLEENLYQSQNCFMLFSAERTNAGTILFSSKSADDIYGTDSQLLIGKHVITLTTPALQPLTAQRLNQQIEKENPEYFNKIIHTFSHHHEGHMFEVEYYVNICSLLNQSFCLAGVVKKVPTSRECIIINHKGDIEGATKIIREELGLGRQGQMASFNIQDLSKELSKVNKAFNKIASLKENKNNQNNESMVKMNAENEKSILYRDADAEEIEDEIDIENAKNLCSVYITEGKVLTLRSVYSGKTYPYLAKFSNAFPEDFHKRLITFENVNDNTHKEKKKTKNIRKTETKSNEVNMNKCDDEDADFFKLEDEKQTFTDRFPLMNLTSLNNLEKSSKKRFEMKKGKVSEKVQIEVTNFASPTSRSEKFLLKTQHYTEDVLKPSQLFEENEDKIPAKKKQKLDKAEGSVAESRVSSESNQLKLSNAFKAAVTAKSHPKYFRLLCILFYIILVTVLNLQIYIKATWEHNLLALKVKKDILSNVLLRNYYSAALPGYFATIIAITNKKIDLSSIYLVLESVFYGLENDLEALRETNNILLRDTNTLSEEIRSSLFYKDIRMFELCSGCLQQPYIKVDNFLATNAILESALKLMPLAKSNVTQVRDEINIFSENCLNDLILKNANIVDIFLNSLDTQREEIFKLMSMFLIITVILLLLNGLLMSINIWNHYLIETSNFKALTKLNSARVSRTLTRLKNFEDLVENQNNFEASLIKNSDRFSFYETGSSLGRRAKTDFLKNADIKGLCRKYYLHILRLCILAFCLSGLACWSSRAVHKFIDNIYEKQSQIYLANSIKSTVTVAGHSISDIFTNGLSRKTENLPVLTFLSNSLKEINDLRLRIPKVFSIQTLEKGSTLEQILIGDGCQVTDSNYRIFCNVASSHGILPSFTQILTNYEGYLTNFYQEFSKLNQTEILLYKPEPENYLTFSSVFVIILGQVNVLIEKCDKAYETTLEESKTERSLIFGAFIASSGVLAISFWIFVLKDIREVENRFKKVLQVFPPNLVLSNFYLKLFLIKTSRGALDFVRNGIDNN